MIHISSNTPVAYICAEYAIDDRLPIYAGGLGVLAGDILIEASEQDIPFVAVGLYNWKGFSSYPPRVKNGKVADPQDIGFAVVHNESGDRVVISVVIGKKEIFAQVWKKAWGFASLYLLDTNIAENSDQYDKDIASVLYPEAFDERMRQEIVLGMGSVALFSALDIHPSVYHLNEGHMSFVALALALQEHQHPESFTDALDRVRPKLVGTKHTILPGAGLFFSKEQSNNYFGKIFQDAEINHDEFFALGTQEHDREQFSTTEFLLRACIRTSAVSALHADFEHKQCPECQILIPITNGISKSRWMLPALASEVSDEELWDIHNAGKQELAHVIQEKTGQVVDTKSLVIVWARRIAEYKRPLLIFQDMERLQKILENSTQPVTILFSGNAYGFDATAKGLLEQVIEMTKKADHGRVLYVPGYSLSLSKKLVAGADLWLNTPEFGMEASGTSGMKASINGILQLSVGDGWFGEVKDKDCFWTLDPGHTAESLYELLEHEVIPTFYARDDRGYPRQWINKMKQARRIILEHYTTSRMLDEYMHKLYFPEV
ncbi:MAG: alpha-glucan family phosphorylase [Candidatus Andersenbacteria bacterium]